MDLKSISFPRKSFALSDMSSTGTRRGGICMYFFHFSLTLGAGEKIGLFLKVFRFRKKRNRKPNTFLWFDLLVHWGLFLREKIRKFSKLCKNYAMRLLSREKIQKKIQKYAKIMWLRCYAILCDIMGMPTTNPWRTSIWNSKNYPKNIEFRLFCSHGAYLALDFIILLSRERRIFVRLKKSTKIKNPTKSCNILQRN